MSPEAGDCAPLELKQVNLRTIHKLAVCGFLAVALLATRQLNAQHLTLEGQTGGFLTPTAYVVESDKGQVFSHPAIGFHFINASKVIGNIETFSITEGFANRAEVGYTRSVHQFGDSGQLTTASTVGLSKLWNTNGMNVFHGKVVAIKDGQFGPWTPGVGGRRRGAHRRQICHRRGSLATDQCVLTIPRFSWIVQLVAVPTAKAYTNGDVYIAVTKTWAKKPVPFLANIGWKATNATIFGIGGQSTRFGGRLFGGLGIPLPLGHGIVAVPSAGFTQEPRHQQGTQYAHLSPAFPGSRQGGSSHDPGLCRARNAEGNPHFAFDIGIGQVAGNIGAAPTFTLSLTPPSTVHGPHQSAGAPRSRHGPQLPLLSRSGSQSLNESSPPCAKFIGRGRELWRYTGYAGCALR